MGKKIKWGVIGSGGIARRRTIPEGIVVATNAELSVVYDVNQDVNNQVAQEFNVKATNSIDELLADDIQAVYIAAPANLHFEQAMQCVERGKNVLCEKPLGLTATQAQVMSDTFEKKGLILGTALMMRFHCQHQLIKKLNSVLQVYKNLL